MEDDHVRRCPAAQQNGGTHGPRRANQRSSVRGLYRAMLGADAQAWRHRRDRHLPAHKVAGVKDAIEAAGATLQYLPQYSPDLNPIEMPFSKFKACERPQSELSVVFAVGYVRSCQPSVARNVEITSDMPAMCPYD